MRVAICFSGHIRDLYENKEFWKGVISKYNADVFGSFWDDENEELGDTVDTFKKIYNPHRVEVESHSMFKETTTDFASLYIQPPTDLIGYLQEAAKNFGQLPMYYRIWRCNLLTKMNGVKYDVVVRARTDTKFDHNFTIELNDMLNIPMGVGGAVYPDSTGINDCLAYGSSKLMDYYSFTFLQLLQYLDNGHYLIPAEHVLRVHMSKIRINIRFFMSYMTLTRRWRGAPNENFNGFVKDPREIILNTDEWGLIKPSTDVTFKINSIKEKFKL